MDKLRNYPKKGLVSEQSGCKVGWRIYSTKEQAEVCSKAARHNAVILASKGYDFGWQVPGSVREFNGQWQVVIP